MKKIIFLVSSIKERSGVERTVSVLANELCDFYDIEIINRDTQFIDSAYPLSNRIKVTKLQGGLFKFYLNLRQYLNTLSPDLVVVHNMGKLSLVASFLPSKVRLWSYEHVARISRRRWINFFGRILYSRYEKILTITKNDAHSYKEQGIVADVIYNPSPYFLYSNYNDSSKTIISIGRLVPQKGFDNLIKAWSMIANIYHDWNLHIYGEGKDKVYLKTLISQCKMDNIFLMDSTSEIDDVYKNASFYVMSSRYEGLPMVLIEAQTFSLPIVSFDCPFGPSEVITHDYDGLLVEDQKVEKLSCAIEKMILNKESRIIFSNNASKSALRFSKEQIISQWKNLID